RANRGDRNNRIYRQIFCLFSRKLSHTPIIIKGHIRNLIVLRPSRNSGGISLPIVASRIRKRKLDANGIDGSADGSSLRRKPGTGSIIAGAIACQSGAAWHSSRSRSRLAEPTFGFAGSRNVPAAVGGADHKQHTWASRCVATRCWTWRGPEEPILRERGILALVDQEKPDSGPVGNHDHRPHPDASGDHWCGGHECRAGQSRPRYRRAFRRSFCSGLVVRRPRGTRFGSKLLLPGEPHGNPERCLERRPERSAPRCTILRRRSQHGKQLYPRFPWDSCWWGGGQAGESTAGG